MTTITIKEPYADQVYVLNEDNEFECEHDLFLTKDSFDHDWNGGGTEEMIIVECVHGCDIPDHIAQAYVDNYYDDLARGYDEY